MKKQASKKLKLSVETVRTLPSADLGEVAGGLTTAVTCGCTVVHCNTTAPTCGCATALC